MNADSAKDNDSGSGSVLDDLWKGIRRFLPKKKE